MKIVDMFNKAANTVKVVKEVGEALGILLEDADHDGKPDILERVQEAVDLVVNVVKAHVAQVVVEVKQVKGILAEVKDKLDEVRAGAQKK